MDIILSQEDTEWINAKYPRLKIDPVSKNMIGDINFTRSYESYEVSDSYTIKIALKTSGTSMLPKVYEVSNKIMNTAMRHKKDMEDLHINTDGSFCLSIQDREDELFEDKFTIQEFMQKAIEPFLFQMSYFDREGKFPWGEYAHGYLGYLELYAEGKINLDRLLDVMQKKEIIHILLKNRQSSCVCGSGKKLRICHPMVFRAINKIKII